MVYEGSDDCVNAIDPIEACCSLENCCIDSEDLAKFPSSHHHNHHNHQSCCYDADVSSDLNMLSSSHEDDNTVESHQHLLNQRSQQQLRDECRRVVEPSGKPFIPFSEETMFCDAADLPAAAGTNSVVPITGGDTSSPVSNDSWMNYSSHSSDDYSFLLENTNKTGRGKNAKVAKNKRSQEPLQFDNDDDEDGVKKRNEDDDSDRQGNNESTENEEDSSNVGCFVDDDVDEGHGGSVDESLSNLQIHSKRLRSKDMDNGGVISGSLKRNSVFKGNQSRRTSTNSQSNPQLVDIRIIDFAHTTFVHKNSTPKLIESQSDAAVHHGPDCGFLAGVDSLKRLLMEIISDSSNGMAADLTS